VQGLNLAGNSRNRIAAIRVWKEETPAPPLGYIAGIRAGLVRQNAVSSPASSEKFLHFCGVKPESSIGPLIGQASHAATLGHTAGTRNRGCVPPQTHCSSLLIVEIWLGDLDSNQDSQIQSLESYQLDDLPAEGESCTQHRKASLRTTTATFLG
jgi:hypothetical protein